MDKTQEETDNDNRKEGKIDMQAIFEQNNQILEKLEQMEKNNTVTNERIVDIYTKLNILKTDVDGVIQSQVVINKEFEYNKQKTTKLEKDVKSLLTKDTNYSADIANIKKSTKDLRDLIDKSNQAINDLEQYGRRNMLDIRGIPRMKEENTDDLVLKIAEIINIQLDSNDIEVSHRTSSQKDAPIIVKFLARHKRNLFYKNRMNLQGKTVENIGYEFGKCKNKIFVNESLTAKNGMIYKTAREKLKVNNLFKHVWTVNGQILVRKDDNGKKIILRSLKDINDLLSYNE